MLSRFSKAWERKDEYVFPSGFRHGSRLGSNRNSKIKPPEKSAEGKNKATEIHRVSVALARLFHCFRREIFGSGSSHGTISIRVLLFRPLNDRMDMNQILRLRSVCHAHR